MGETTHTCSSAAKIDILERELERVRNTTAEDHDLLMTIKVQVGMILVAVSELTNKVGELTTQPSARYERLKLAGGVAIVTALATYIANLVIERL